MNILIYNEFTANQREECCLSVYPQGLHRVIKTFIEAANSENKVTCVTLDTIGRITEEVLLDTDVVLWWGHVNHDSVPDEIADLVVNHVRRGMGLIVLHSGHYSKPFTRLMGTTCSLSWREAKERERLWVVEPTHPIALGLPEYFELPQEEMYGERFDIPTPDELVLLGWFQGGDVFRSGVTYRRGYGKVFYFQPGHETYGTYYNSNIQRVILNAIDWAKPLALRVANISSPNRKMIEPIER